MSFGALIVLFLFGFALFGIGTGSSTQSSATTATATAAGYLVTQAGSGRSYRVSRGDEVTIRLSHRWHWSRPHANGPVDLQQVVYVRDPGYDEWTVRPVKNGTATITATGTPGAKRFRLTVRVR